MQNRSMAWIAPMAVGALAMYVFDPDRGARRRALIRDKTIWASRKTRDGAAALGCDLQNRASGLAAQMRGLVEHEAVDDRRLESRVRAELGRVCSHPGAITVFASGGHVTLSGAILSSEHGPVCRAVSRVRGVIELSDALEVHDEAGTIPALQGEGRARPDQRRLISGWSPTAQLVAAVAGAGAIAYGARRRVLHSSTE